MSIFDEIPSILARGTEPRSRLEAFLSWCPERRPGVALIRARQDRVRARLYALCERPAPAPVVVQMDRAEWRASEHAARHAAYQRRVAAAIDAASTAHGNFSPSDAGRIRAAMARETARRRLEPTLAALYDRAGYELGSGAGDREVAVRVCEPGQQPAAWSTSKERWPRYGEVGRKYRWRVCDITHTIRVRRDWRARVQRRGCAIVDGLLTLDYDHRSGRAVIARQHGATGIRDESCYLAEHGGVWAHGRTYAAALDRAYTRAAHAQQTALQCLVVALRDAAVAAAAGDIMVTLDDSVAAGNCRIGSADWAARHFPGRSSATGAEILAVTDRRDFAVRAVRAALVRQRREGRAA